MRPVRNADWASRPWPSPDYKEPRETDHQACHRTGPVLDPFGDNIRPGPGPPSEETPGCKMTRMTEAPEEGSG